MDYNSVEDSPELDPYQIKELALKSAITIDNYRINGKISEEGEESINELSEIFFGMKKLKWISPEISSGLINLYWPRSKDDLYSSHNKKLIGKNWEDFNLQSWLFAKDLSTFRKSSEERRKDLIDFCLELNRGLSAGNYKLRLAA